MIRLFYNVFRSENAARQAELDECLARNLANPLLDVVTFEQQKRPTFDELFALVKTCTGPDDVNILANSDIWFDKSIAHATQVRQGQVFCLTRWDWKPGPPVVAKFLGRGYSQDAWIFRGALENVRGDFPLGVLACDGRIAFELHKAGYELKNPSWMIKAYHHHASAWRTYGPNFLPGPKLSVKPGPLHRLPVRWPR
jgi:hypothetical protein